jgi:hypothetical protein
MNANCDACARGASKVDGHAALMVHSFAMAGMIFKCRQCDLAWRRSYSSDGVYGWTRLAGRMSATAGVGIMMPAASPR